MGFLDNIKKAFDSGGIDVEIDVPKTFRWSDGSLPVSVTIDGHESEPRTITSIRLQLVEDDDDESSVRRERGRLDGLNFTQTETITIEPGGTVTRVLSLPLTVGDAVSTVTDAEAPGWLSAVSKATSAISELTRETPWYILRVIPEVEGAGAKKIASRRIRNLRTGEWGDGGMISGSIGLG